MLSPSGDFAKGLKECLVAIERGMLSLGLCIPRGCGRFFAWRIYHRNMPMQELNVENQKHIVTTSCYGVLVALHWFNLKHESKLDPSLSPAKLASLTLILGVASGCRIGLAPKHI